MTFILDNAKQTLVNLKPHQISKQKHGLVDGLINQISKSMAEITHCQKDLIQQQCTTLGKIQVYFKVLASRIHC
jgi:hypothetical protein